MIRKYLLDNIGDQAQNYVKIVFENGIIKAYDIHNGLDYLFLTLNKGADATGRKSAYGREIAKGGDGGSAIGSNYGFYMKTIYCKDGLPGNSGMMTKGRYNDNDVAYYEYRLPIN